MLYVCRAGLWFISVFHTLAADVIVTIKPEASEKKLSEYDWDVWCKFQPNGYDCTTKGGVPRFYYDVKMGACKTFTYEGCPTTYNNFETETSCNHQCRDYGLRAVTVNISDKVSCRMQPDFGRCDGYYPMWYFDITRRMCRGFSYSGCGGNYNRFSNAQVCTAICRNIVDF